MSDATHHMTFATQLDPDECCRRLKARCASWWDMVGSGFTMQIDPDRPVYGRVTTRGFSLFVRIAYRNSFQTRASGRFQQEGAGTRVDVRFGMATAVKVFTALWVAVVLFTLLAALFMRSQGAVETGELAMPFLAIPILMLAFMAGLLTFGRWLARNEERVLREFLARELEPGPETRWTPIG